MGKDILLSLRPALVLTLLFALLLGVAYPLAITGIGQALFPHQANGSLIVEGGKAIGSERIGQSFSDPRYFSPRPSAAGKGYDGMASSGSNLGPTSQALVDRVKSDIAKFQAMSPGSPVPVRSGDSLRLRPRPGHLAGGGFFSSDACRCGAGIGSRHGAGAGGTDDRASISRPAG